MDGWFTIDVYALRDADGAVLSTVAVGPEGDADGLRRIGVIEDGAVLETSFSAPTNDEAMRLYRDAYGVPPCAPAGDGVRDAHGPVRAAGFETFPTRCSPASNGY